MIKTVIKTVEYFLTDASGLKHGPPQVGAAAIISLMTEVCTTAPFLLSFFLIRETHHAGAFIVLSDISGMFDEETCQGSCHFCWFHQNDADFRETQHQPTSLMGQI